jgi:hypothetical protein
VRRSQDSWTAQRADRRPPGRYSNAARVGWAHPNSAYSFPSPSRCCGPHSPVSIDLRLAAKRADVSSERQAHELSMCSHSAGAPQPRRTRRDAWGVRARSVDVADTDDPSHSPHGAYPAGRATTGARALPRPLRIRRSPAFGAAQSSVAQGAPLTAASCFHTLVSPIRRPAALRARTIHAARRTAVRNRVGGRGSGCSGRCAQC